MNEHAYVPEYLIDIHYVCLQMYTSLRRSTMSARLT